MGWINDGRYCTRSRWLNGRIVREYIGGGEIGRLAAQLDEIDRESRRNDRALAKFERENLEELDGPVKGLNDLGDLLVQAAMLAAGYHRHHRGEWRKSRGDSEEK